MHISILSCRILHLKNHVVEVLENVPVAVNNDNFTKMWPCSHIGFTRIQRCREKKRWMRAWKQWPSFMIVSAHEVAVTPLKGIPSMCVTVLKQL